MWSFQSHPGPSPKPVETHKPVLSISHECTTPQPFDIEEVRTAVAQNVLNSKPKLGIWGGSS
jgi:hypothetical protein